MIIFWQQQNYKRNKHGWSFKWVVHISSNESTIQYPTGFCDTIHRFQFTFHKIQIKPPIQNLGSPISCQKWQNNCFKSIKFISLVLMYCVTCLHLSLSPPSFPRHLFTLLFVIYYLFLHVVHHEAHPDFNETLLESGMCCSKADEFQCHIFQIKNVGKLSLISSSKLIYTLWLKYCL